MKIIITLLLSLFLLACSKPDNEFELGENIGRANRKEKERVVPF